MILFLTGTDTGVGKTHTAVQLLRAARAGGLAMRGPEANLLRRSNDAERLLAASSEGLTIDEINPVWLKTPVAPLSGSLIEQVVIDEQRLVDALHKLEDCFDFVLIEGVGGMARSDSPRFFCEGSRCANEIAVMVVVQNRLGCLNHTILTVRSVIEHGLVCAGVVLNDPAGLTDIAANTNADILRQILDVPILPMLAEAATELTPEWRTAGSFSGNAAGR